MKNKCFINERKYRIILTKSNRRNIIKTFVENKKFRMCDYTSACSCLEMAILRWNQM
jgi:hypothetical protein